jgi:hypothetical protein
MILALITLIGSLVKYAIYFVGGYTIVKWVVDHV